MSDVTAYAMIGYKVPKDKIDYVQEKYEEYYKPDTRSHDIPVEVVVEPYSNDFAVIGIILDSIGSDNFDLDEGSDAPHMNTSELSEYISEFFPELELDPFLDDIKFYLFNVAY